MCPSASPRSCPASVRSIEYDLEYGTDDLLEIHADAIEPGQNVLIVNDVLATGGTASAVARLVQLLDGKVVGLGFVIELDFLHRPQPACRIFELFSLLHY